VTHLGAALPNNRERADDFPCFVSALTLVRSSHLWEYIITEKSRKLDDFMKLYVVRGSPDLKILSRDLG
jgi:hypothetical protein